MWSSLKRVACWLALICLAPLAVNGSIINIDFNGDRNDPGPNARPLTYQGQGPVGGGAYWNGLAADSRLPDGTDDDNLTVGGTNLLDAAGASTTLSFVVSPMGGDSTALRTGQNTTNPQLSPALLSDYIFNNSAGNAAGESPFEIGGLGGATNVDIYFYRSSGGVQIPGRSQSAFAASGIFNSGNTIYYKNVPVVGGVVRGTFGSGTAVIHGMTVVCACAIVPTPITFLEQPTNAMVLEGASAAFQVRVANLDPVAYQWQRNGVNLPGASQSTYTISRVSRTNDGEQFRCLVTNLLGSATTTNAVLTVIPDTTPPAIREAQNIGRSSIRVVFSEPVDPATAANATNYWLSPGGAVLGVVLDSDMQTVRLAATDLTYGVAYTLRISNVLDRAWAPNSIPAGSSIVFVATEYYSGVIGGAGVEGALTIETNGFVLSASGGNIGGVADQFVFAYQQREGDFDVQVRIESFDLADAWAKAGLMARENLSTNSRFAAILATPALAGTFFSSRSVAGQAAVAAGSYPVNYPYTWLRLERIGNVFNGYAAVAEGSWTKLGSVTLVLPGTIYFGMAGAGYSSAQAAIIQFRDLTNAVRDPVAPVSASRESLTACSRRTGLVISEIMYHPGPQAGGADLEFVELFNSQSFFQELSGLRLSGDIDYTFPAGTILPAGGFVVIARNPLDVQRAYGLSGVLGPYAHRLPGGSGTVRLRDSQEAILLEVQYGSQSPWPRSADGAGHSMVLARPSFGEGDPKAWAASDRIGGSPGMPDGVGPDPLRSVVINEFLAHTEGAGEDFIELYNHGNQAVDLSGSFLTDDPASMRFIIPPATALPARGFVSFNRTQLGFGLSSAGGTIYFVNPGWTRVLDAAEYGGQAANLSAGRYPDGAPTIRELITPTPGTTNSAWLAHDIVINEIMYHPISENDEDEYVELYNRGTNELDASYWRLEGAVDYTFPTNLAIPGGGYLVVAKNYTNLLAKYSNLNAGNLIGDYRRTLSNRGDRLRLLRPDLAGLLPGNPAPITNQPYILVTEVDYGGGGRWGKWADGGGSSLELVDPRGDQRLASNWRDSDEGQKTTNWTTIEHTGRLDSGNATYAADSLHILLLGEGECLIDNVEVKTGTTGANLVANSTFETGVSGWFLQGDHRLSSRETNGGYQSTYSLHLRATGDGDNGANRIRTQLTTPLGIATTATLRARVRWLRGHPEILLRLHGNWLEATGPMAVPSNLGTPGAPNSRSIANAGPAIYDVAHTPVLPAAREQVIVTARAHDPDGIASLRLRWRVDPATSFTTLDMLDDGSGGDAVAGDGVYSAAIPGQNANVLAAFHVVAADQAVPSAAAKFPDDAPARECLIRFGEPQPAGSFGTYRLWMTQAVLNRWSTREQLSNEPLDVTFVGSNQRVIYNAGAMYSGSPYKTRGYDSPAGVWCDYLLRFPSDDRFLGVTDFKICYPGNINDDATLQREQTAYWLAGQLGLPFNHRRYVNLFVNGVKRGVILEDTQVPNSDVIAEHYPQDTEGELFKVSLWFEFADANLGDFTPTPATLQKFTTTGGLKKLARYRWNWPKHAVKGSVNDYASLFDLVEALNSGAAVYTGQVESLADVEQWMGIFAVEHIVGNWDSFGYRNGSNLYAYKTRAGRWQLLIWDIDVSLRSDYGTGPTSDLFEAGDPTIDRMLKHPPFRRAYWRALQDAANGPLLNSRVDPLLDARYVALQQNGVSAQNPSVIKTWIQSRRDYILQQLATVTANFAINGPEIRSTNRDEVILTGSAPIDVKSILVNGRIYPLTWTSVTAWSMAVSLQPGATNLLTLVGYDRRNQWVAGASNLVTVISTAIPSQPTNYVLINEWLAGNTTLADPADGNYDDWIELYNSGTNAADLSGWFLTDDLSRPALWRIPGGTSIPPQGFLLVWADGQTNENGFNADLHADFKLDRAGETIGLANAAERLVDSVVFGAQTNNVSQGRFPDGGESPFVFMPTPTPRAPNRLGAPDPWVGLTSISIGENGSVDLVWNTALGKTYRVEYKERLGAGPWTVLGDTMIGTGTFLMISDPAVGVSQRFYRIVQIDGAGAVSP